MKSNNENVFIFKRRFMNDHPVIKQSICIFLFFLTLIVALISIPVLIICEFIYFFSMTYPIYICTILSHTIWTIYNVILKINADIIIEGDINQVGDEENCIVLSNHIGSIDFMIGHEIARQKKMLKHCKFLVKKSVMWIPLIGWGVKFLKFCFLDRRFCNDKALLYRWARFMKTHNVPMWLIMYPEGSRFTEQKYAESVDFCKSRGIPPLNQLLYPRSKGFSLIFNEYRDYLTSLIDITIKYVDTDGQGVPTLFRFMLLQPKGYFRVYIKSYKFSEIENPEKFLIELWEKKSKILASWDDQIKKAT